MDNIMSTIIKAAKEIKTMIIAYEDERGIITQREVEPYSQKRDGLYAYCENHEGIRFFKLSKILDARVTKKTYVPRWTIEIGKDEEKE